MIMDKWKQEHEQEKVLNYWKLVCLESILRMNRDIIYTRTSKRTIMTDAKSWVETVGSLC